MSAQIVLSCDGHRHGMPCRGAYPTGTDYRAPADERAHHAGWRNYLHRSRWLDLCPSPGHDEEA